MKNRCVLVLGVGRCGSSAVAGVLHRLGCDMGDEFVPADHTNPFGTYEDWPMYLLTHDIVAGQASPEAYKPLVGERARRGGVWGVKDPELCRAAQHLWPLLGDARAVVVRRPRAECVNSLMRAYALGRARAEHWHDRMSDALEARLAEFGGPVMEVEFADLLGDPRGVTERLAAFAFEGYEPPAPRYLIDAASHVHPKDKPKVEGWGDVAVGVRIANHPEPAFFADWTALLTGGLRTGDGVLKPMAHMPAHWASNALTKHFLKGGKDSLLLIDDDMSFPMDAVKRLRGNEANWEYDVVMAFCTHRVWPPKPVVMRLMDRPPMPMRLRGDHFEILTDFEDGEVVEVDIVGLAFTLFKRRVFEAMVDREFGLEYTWFFDYGRGRESDDVSFCRRLRQLGFRMAVDTSVKIRHVGAHPMGWDDFQKWKRERETKELELDAAELRPILEAARDRDDGAGAKAREILETIGDAAAQV